MAKTRASSAHDLERLVASVLGTRKYARVMPELVAEIGRRELAKRARLRDATQTTRQKLHQLFGACLAAPRFDEWRTALETAPDDAALRTAAQRVLSAHASTRERLPELPAFFRELEPELAPGTRVLDLGCGVQPLAWLWHPRARALDFTACDADLALVDFLGAFFALARLRGRAVACDLAQGAPPLEADVALLLKVLPALDRLDESAGARLLESLRARRLVVSFPRASIGGRAPFKRETWERRIDSLVAARPWRVVRSFELDSELLFVLQQP